MNIADNIIYFIKSLDMKISDVEAEIGVATGYFSRVKKLGKSVPYSKIKAVADFIGVDPSVLVADEDNEASKTIADDNNKIILFDLLNKTVCGELLWEDNKTTMDRRVYSFKEDKLFVNGSKSRKLNRYKEYVKILLSQVNSITNKIE